MNKTAALLLLCTALFAQQKGTLTDTRDGKVYKTIFCIIICCFCIFTCKSKETEKPKEEVKETDNIDKPSLNLSLHFSGQGIYTSSDTIDGKEFEVLKYPYTIKILNDSIMISASWTFFDPDEYRGKLTEEQYLKIKNMVSDLNQEYETLSDYRLHASPCILKIDNKVRYKKKTCVNNLKFSSSHLPLMPKEILILFRYIVDLPSVRTMTHHQITNNLPTARGTFTDTRDGKIYKTAKFGEQVWMTENLNYEMKGFFGLFTIGNKCFDNDPAYCSIYGRLYNWKTAMKACPKGWHLPFKAEWDALTIGGTKYFGDTIGFSALLGGEGHTRYSFSNVGYQGYWWIADKYDATYRKYKFYEGGYVSDGYIVDDIEDDDFLFSVRCLQDPAPPKGSAK